MFDLLLISYFPTILGHKKTKKNKNSVYSPTIEKRKGHKGASSKGKLI